MKMRSAFRFTRFGLALVGALGVAPAGTAGNTDIADEPLSQAASGVRPNIMFILDASGSMAWDYIPDYINDSQSGNPPTTTAACFDSGDDDSGSITGTPDACIPGDPPYMSPDFNKQYYNPSIYYRPGVNADGTDMTNMNAANTSGWTAVPTDPYGQQQRNQLGTSTATEDLTADYPDRAWCKSTSNSPTDTTNCQVNSAYTYPDWQFNRSSSSGKYRFGAPYYYRMQSAQWCSTSTLDAGTCVSGSAVNPNIHRWIAPEFCTDPELVNCAAGAALTPQHVFSGPRWCSDKNTLINCQRKKVGSFIWPKHLGATVTTSVNLPATPASATVTITSAPSGQQVTGLTVGGVNIISGNLPASGSTSAMASDIAASIQGFTSSPDYTATVSGSTITITAVTAGTSGNGKTIVLTSTVVGTVSATAQITVNSSGSNNAVYVAAIQVDHPTLGVIDIMSATCSGSYGNSVSTVTGGTYGNQLRANTGTNSGSERASLAAGIADCINQASASTGFSATASNSTVTIRAPVSLGDTINTHTVSVVKSGGSYGVTAFSGGQSAGVTASTSGSTSGGTDPTSAIIPVHVGVGQFARVDIVPSDNTYPKASTRVDCASSTTCTYAEEMTNFANWYSYYRTRLQMMKSAAGRAFVPIDDTYKVGFITIKPFSDPSTNSGSVVAGRYLRIATFDPTQKSVWYKKFYQQTAGGGTPLREALSRVGQIYAGNLNTGLTSGIPTTDDPVDVSCQPNFAILSTDGYWNGNAGVDVSGGALGQQDNQNVSPYSLQTDGVYDGGKNTTVGLADVSLYYYETDLRPTGSTNAATGVDVSPNNVPTTQFDFASHQHMTTFTLGLGLDGTLTYRSDYQTANSGDFFAIRQGTITWPNPVADSPTALDDLWHAAVNGRGVFFSASNPQELANSLSSTLDALKKRVGAGAAAATSNLQPVAGDNFAFTAQYQTQDWIGDLKARTIDLDTGAISTVQLWSAQAQLNGRDPNTRILFTFDPSDPYNSTSTGAVGNQLKHFCVPTAVGTSPWCVDGTGLTATELAYFNPNQLTQYGSYNPLTQLPNATAENLVNFLRGYQAFEDQGNGSSTDLFRNRSALLGDIINAQPSYVRTAPFSYTDPGYSDFKSCTQGTTTVTCPAAQFPSPTIRRRPTVYIAANDGMLHAIETDVNNSPYYQTGGIATATTSDDTFSSGNNTGNGVERWAYIPSMVLPNLYRLANIPYAHRYFVDGSPTVGDICISTPCSGLSDWRTILVGGLNAGGRGFYALDVTNPLKPRALWEFKVRKPSVTPCAVTAKDAVGATDDCDLGLSYGDPIVTKLKATGQWVVIVTSGLNNTGVEPGTTLRQGDGGGYLYILDAVTGKILKKIPTGVGSPGTAALSYTDADPSGLAKINNWVDNSLTDNTTLAVYGGDMKGNLWRFDLDSASVTYLVAVKVAALTDSTGVNPQPITTKPELGLISSRRVIFLGTGRFLGVSDKADTTQQTIYAIADDLAGNTAVTGRTGLVQQVMTQNSPTTRTVSSVQTVDWTNPAVRGWYIDLPDSGERVNVDPQLQLGTLVVASNVPSTDTCVAGGTAWINSLDFKTGGFVEGATGNAVSQQISASVAVGINVIQLPGGKVVTVVTTADNQQLPVNTPVAPTSFQGKRVGWRELNADQ